MQRNKDNLFNKWCWENWKGTRKKNEARLLSYNTRINPKWMKDLNIGCGTMKTLVENAGSKISDISCSNIFADISPMAKEIKKKK